MKKDRSSHRAYLRALYKHPEATDMLKQMAKKLFAEHFPEEPTDGLTEGDLTEEEVWLGQKAADEIVQEGCELFQDTSMRNMDGDEDFED